MSKARTGVDENEERMVLGGVGWNRPGGTVSVIACGEGVLALLSRKLYMNDANTGIMETMTNSVILESRAVEVVAIIHNN